MARLHIPVGIPGCGKSTFGSVLIGRHGHVASTDAIRADLGDVNDQSRNDEVFTTYHSLIKQWLDAGVDVYADATNLRDFARERLREIAERTGATTHLWVFENKAQACVRNQQRERVVPFEVMLKMVEQYEKAMKDILGEQYDTVTYISGVS